MKHCISHAEYFIYIHIYLQYMCKFNFCCSTSLTVFIKLVKLIKYFCVTCLCVHSWWKTRRFTHSRLSQTCIFWSIPAKCLQRWLSKGQLAPVSFDGPVNGSFLWLLWNKTNTSLRTPSHSPASQHAAENVHISKTCHWALTFITLHSSKNLTVPYSAH